MLRPSWFDHAAAHVADGDDLRADRAELLGGGGADVAEALDDAALVAHAAAAGARSTPSMT